MKFGGRPILHRGKVFSVYDVNLFLCEVVV